MITTMYQGYTGLPPHISDPMLESFYGRERDPFDAEEENPDDPTDLIYHISPTVDVGSFSGGFPPGKTESRSDIDALSQTMVAQLGIIIVQNGPEELKIALDAVALEDMDIDVSNKLLSFLLRIAAASKKYDAIKLLLDRWEENNIMEDKMSTVTYVFTLGLDREIYTCIGRALPDAGFVKMMIELIEADSSPEVGTAAIELTRVFGPVKENDEGLIGPITRDVDTYRAYSTWSALYEYSRSQIFRESVGNVRMHEYIKARMEMVAPWRNPPSHMITDPLGSDISSRGEGKLTGEGKLAKERSIPLSSSLSSISPPSSLSVFPPLRGNSSPSASSSPSLPSSGKSLSDDVKIVIKYKDLDDYYEFTGGSGFLPPSLPEHLRRDVKIAPRKIYPSLIGRDVVPPGGPIEDQLDAAVEKELSEGGTLDDLPDYPTPVRDTGIALSSSAGRGPPLKELILPGSGSYLYVKEDTPRSATMVINPSISQTEDESIGRDLDGGPSVDGRAPFEDDVHHDDGPDTVAFTPELEWDESLPLESALATTIDAPSNEKIDKMISDMEVVNDIVTLIIKRSSERKGEFRDEKNRGELTRLHKLALTDGDPEVVKPGSGRGFYLPSSRRIAEILTSGLFTSGSLSKREMYKVRDMVEIEVVRMSRDNKIRLVTPYVEMKNMYETLGDDPNLLRLYGPANPMVGTVPFGKSNCFRYGGCRMLLCNHLDGSYVFGEGDEDEEFDADTNAAAIIPRYITKGQLPSEDEIRMTLEEDDKRDWRNTFFVDLDSKVKYARKVKIPDTIAEKNYEEAREVAVPLKPLALIGDQSVGMEKEVVGTPEIIRGTPETPERRESPSSPAIPESPRGTGSPTFIQQSPALSLSPIQKFPSPLPESYPQQGFSSPLSSSDIREVSPIQQRISSPLPVSYSQSSLPQQSPLISSSPPTTVTAVVDMSSPLSPIYRSGSPVPYSLGQQAVPLVRADDDKSALSLSETSVGLPYGTPSIINIPTGTSITDRRISSGEEDRDDDEATIPPLNPIDGLPTNPVPPPPKTLLSSYGARISGGTPGLIGQSVVDVAVGPLTHEEKIPLGMAIEEGSPTVNSGIPPSQMYSPPAPVTENNYYLIPQLGRDRRLKEESGELDAPRWFRGACDRCHLRIRRPCHASRRPAVGGGWKGCYCCMECVENDVQDVNPLTTALIAHFRKKIDEIGIYDRLYPPEKPDNWRLREEDEMEATESAADLPYWI